MNRDLDGYPVVIEQAVAWGDMDALRHVNNAVYFKYFESARLAFMEAIPGWGQMGERAIIPVLASASARYKLPLTYPDTIEVGARVGEVKADRFVMDYAVYSHAHRRIATLGSSLVVTVTRSDGRKAPMPADLCEALRGVVPR